jgi:uncharacterized membrane protein
MLILLFFALAAIYLIGNTYKLHVLSGLSISMLGLYPSFGIYRALKMGVIQTYGAFRGTYRRDLNPIGFWISVVFLAMGTIFFLSFGIAVMLGLVPPAGWHK